MCSPRFDFIISGTVKRNGIARIALFVLAGAAAAAHAGADAPLSAPEIEEASAAARRAAGALARQAEPALEKSFDERALVTAAVGAPMTARLTPRQRRAIGDRMLEWFSAPFSGNPAPSKPPLFLDLRPEGGDALVSLLVPVTTGYLKTTWRVRPAGSEWLVEDVLLPDLGRSLRDEAVESLGPPPVAAPRDRTRESRRLAVPRVVGILAVVVAALVFVRRVRPKERIALLVAAAAPIALFAADGYLAITRVWKEPIALRLSEGAPWQHSVHLFQLAIRNGNRDRARAAAAEAISRGAAPQPLHLVLGGLAEQKAEPREAAIEYTRALVPPRPAPGGWAGLARLAVAAGRDDDSIAAWQKYFELVPADPNALFWLAVAQGHRHDFGAAQATLARAIDLDPSAAELYGLSARLYGAAGDAPAAIARLRAQQNLAPLDRRTIAADGNFVPIAESPEWKAFLEEEPPR
jgi:tetratricopeptide (TPR) repeat protein